MSQRKTGTREWSDISLNIGIGCAHDCRYCYARSEQLRFGTIAAPGDWANEGVVSDEVLDKRLAKLPKSGNQIVMLPTTHDIVPAYMPAVLKAARYVLEKTDHRLLLVSKPHLQCITELCSELAPHKDRIVFRFTIGTVDPEVSLFWEPGAPAPAERLAALRLAFEAGFTTSVSMEPVLGGIDTVSDVVASVAPLVNDVIWIGWLNKGAARLHPRTSEVMERFERDIAGLQTDRTALVLYEKFKSDPMIRWKDSILQALERVGVQASNP